MRFGLLFSPRPGCSGAAGEAGEVEVLSPSDPPAEQPDVPSVPGAGPDPAQPAGPLPRPGVLSGLERRRGGEAEWNQNLLVFFSVCVYFKQFFCVCVCVFRLCVKINPCRTFYRNTSTPVKTSARCTCCWYNTNTHSFNRPSQISSRLSSSPTLLSSLWFILSSLHLPPSPPPPGVTPLLLLF